jgi:cytidylate kinase
VTQALWIGGPPASGKTTIATRIARRHGLRLYQGERYARALACGSRRVIVTDASSSAVAVPRKTPLIGGTSE